MESKADLDALSRLLPGRGKRAQFVKDHQLPGGESMVSQHLSGHRPVSFESAVAYSRALGVPLATVSPYYASLVASLPPQANEPGAAYVVSRPLDEALDILGRALAKQRDTASRAELAEALAAWARWEGKAAYGAVVRELLRA